MAVAEIRTPDDLLAYLRSLPLVERAKLARALANVQTTKRLAAVGDEAVYELTQDQTYAQVASLLGVEYHQVNKAVTRHNGGARPRG